MISRSRTKHPITAPTSTRAIRTDAAFAIALSAIAWAAAGITPLHAADGQPGQLRPVPKFEGSSVRDPRRQAAPTAGGLQWRTSSQVAPAAPPQTTPVRSVQAAESVQPAAAPGGLRQMLSADAAADSSASVRQAQFQLPSGESERPRAPAQTPPADAPPASDFFGDLFDELPPPQTDRSRPGDEPSPAQDAPPVAPQPTPAPEADAPGDDPPAQADAPAQPVPLDPEPSPFDGRRTIPDLPETPDQPPRQIEDFDIPRRDEDRRAPEPLYPPDDVTLIRPVAFTCDDFRRSIAEQTIQKVSLDISPPFRPDVLEMDEYRQIRQRFEERQEIRDWTSIRGTRLGRGRLRDMAYENVIIETEFGTTEEIPVNRLSEADLTYLASHWGLPQDCLIPQPEHRDRTWIASTVTWKASNLIHRPLYFEEVNLERYGHTAGPFLQPVISSAHFFANVAVMPYKMGVHLPNECQYALGYYRPGNCAPWITPPIPLSLRGALFQAGAVTGNVLLIP